MAKTMLQLYPRGFLGEVITSAAANRMGQGNFRSVPNPSIEALYVQYINRAVNTVTIEFRRKVLTVALKAFGTRDFEVWLSSQRQSPVAGENHTGFLEDTLQFLMEGRRSLDIASWQTLVEMADHGERAHDHSERAKEFFGISSNGVNREPRNRSMVDVIQLWCSYPGGIEDMLCTMHVLFGNITPKSIAMGATE